MERSRAIRDAYFTNYAVASPEKLQDARDQHEEQLRLVPGEIGPESVTLDEMMVRADELRRAADALFGDPTRKEPLA